jgi:hypothetical protein
MADAHAEQPEGQADWNTVVEEVLGDEERGMTGVRIKNLRTARRTTIEAPGMFVAIGHTPNTQFLKGKLELDEQGFIVLKEPRARHERRRRLRRRRRRRPDLQAGDHRRGHGLQGRAGRRALAGGERACIKEEFEPRISRINTNESRETAFSSFPIRVHS